MKGGDVMAKVDSAYDYYISTYANQEVSRYDAHKKSELRRVYNRMVKNNKEVPLFKIPDLDDAKRFAIDIKERAKSVQNVVASLSDNNGSLQDSFQKKVAYSNSDSVDVKYIGDGLESDNTDSFEIKINKLASPQINGGNYVKSDSLFFIPGNYSFDLTTNTSSYEFQFSINPGDNNKTVQEKLCNLVNNSNLGIDAELMLDGDSTALYLTSKQTGLDENEPYLFAITPSTDTNSINLVSSLGLGNVTQIADNSDFLLNGVQYNSLSNTFSINNVFELTLKKAHNASESATIGFKTNADAIADNLQTLIDVYNDFLEIALTRSVTNPSSASRLLKDVSALANSDQKRLQNIGLIVSEDGSLNIDKAILADAINPERASDTFKTLSEFKENLSNKADEASIDPMNYVDKVIVTYMKPGHHFNKPYVTSIYSGLMMDAYV